MSLLFPALSFSVKASIDQERMRVAFLWKGGIADDEKEEEEEKKMKKGDFVRIYVVCERERGRQKVIERVDQEIKG